MSLTDVSGTWPEAWRRYGAQASGNRHEPLAALVEGTEQLPPKENEAVASNLGEPICG